MTSVRQAAEEVTKYHENIDIVINNAAVVRAVSPGALRLVSEYSFLRQVTSEQLTDRWTRHTRSQLTASNCN